MLKAMINFRNYRWAARLSGFLSFVLILSFMIGQGFDALQQTSTDKAGVVILSLLALSFLAYLSGWIIEIAGGILMLVNGLIMAFYLSQIELFNHPAYFFILSVSLIIPGIFFTLSWRHKLLRIKKGADKPLHG